MLKTVFYSSINVSYYNLKMKYVLLRETFLVQKLEILSNDDFLLFKEGIPSIQLIKNYKCISNPILSQINFIN
jgi:hypothetical protein